MNTLKQQKLFLLDMDGMLHLDDDLFHHMPEFLDRVKTNGGSHLFLTNNSSKSVEVYRDNGPAGHSRHRSHRPHSRQCKKRRPPPIADIVHGVVLLLVLLFLMPYAGLIPMPTIAAILFVVAYNMSE